MNPDTNELRDLKGADPEYLTKLEERGFIPLPRHLQHVAKVKLAGKYSAVVSRTSSGKYYPHGEIQYIDTYKNGQRIKRKSYDERSKLEFDQDFSYTEQ